ncbi:NlpC/P60 family protein [Anaeroselena agilis]|uniref:C40 family peptidase n=1 Tax=Anaeroselena agilis TaxID=3063788 RepID=A0ABU3NY34_9FIRM|nr:C40 family peptidase [Selenomonadales bacterium 4137-cl]
MTDCSTAVNVSAAMLWTAPGPKRDHDRLILGAATDPAAWADGMDEDMRLWLVGQVESQLLYGERVAVLGREGEWLRVAAAEQASGRDGRGYPGWLPAAQVSDNDVFLAERAALPAAAVTATRTLLYADAAGREPVAELSWQTRLPLLAAVGAMLQVRRPDGAVGYISQYAASPLSPAPFDGERLLAEARRFAGLHYVWGGTSAWGFDCSGFALRLYQSQGVAIPRDADEQAAGGTAVADGDLLPGDLLFFAGPGGQGDIHHVGVFAGDSTMIHAPNSRSAIREDDFTVGKYGEEYWGARRYR